MTSSSSLCSPTKASLYGAVLFTLQEAQWLPVSKSTLILVFTLFMATSKVRARQSRIWLTRAHRAAQTKYITGFI